MTDERDKAIDQPAGSVVAPADSCQPVSVTRRTLLRGATATLPTILTLSSGAALAYSSINRIGTVQTASGDVLCLDPQSTQGPTLQNPNVYELGSPPYAEVTRIPVENDYRTKSTKSTKSSSHQTLTPAEVCKFDGTVEVKRRGGGGWQEVTRRPGAMASSTAVASFGTRIITKDI